MKIRTAIALAVLMAIPVLAQAHAILVSSSPRDKAVLKSAPKQVVLRFDARIEKGLTKVTLHDGSGKRVKLPGESKGFKSGPPNHVIIPMPKLKPGSYRLEYRVLAADGHVTPGLLRFKIAGRTAG